MFARPGGARIDERSDRAKSFKVAVTTAFKDRLPKGLSFAVGASALNEMVGDVVAAAYFINSSTWMRQAVPVDAPELPLLRWQKRRPGLRVGSERVHPLPEACAFYVLVYAVPSTLKHSAETALRASAREWTPKSPSTHEALIVMFSTKSKTVSVSNQLPFWH